MVEKKLHSRWGREEGERRATLEDGRSRTGKDIPGGREGTCDHGLSRRRSLRVNLLRVELERGKQVMVEKNT